MEPIDETLKKIANATSRANTETSATTENTPRASAFPGDPNCPLCGGIGFIRRDLPIDHPDFGKLTICPCRQQAVAQENLERLFRLSNLEAFSNMTFETFSPTGRHGLGDKQIASLSLAFNQARFFAQSLTGWLLLLGGYGCGKTHLAAAVANQAVREGVPTLFLTVPDLLDWLRYSYGSTESNFEERFEEIRNIRLLVLDDLGTQNATAWAQEKLYQIINYRYTNRLPLVVTTNLELDEIEGRVRSRLEDKDLVNKVQILAPDYRISTEEQPEQMKLSTLYQHSGRTFGTFNLREKESLSTDEKRSLEKAFIAAQEFAENPQGWLVLMGDYGTGKTHLAAAIGNWRAGMGEQPIMQEVTDLLDHLRATFNPRSPVSYDKIFNQVRDAPLLILTNLETQTATPWAREKLYQIFNHRYYARKPTVITTVYSMEEIDARIRSRLLDERLCKINKILVPPYHIGPAGEKQRAPRRSTRAPK